jgi:hypothetical protein
MNKAHSSSRSRQRGMVAIMAAVLLVAGVLFILTQTLGLVGTRSVDNLRELDSTAALMLAESGLQRSQAMIGTATTGGLYTDADCTAAGAGGPFSLGRGTFDYTAAVSSPATCGGTGVDPCVACSISAVGKVDATARTLNLSFDIGTVNGVAGKGTTVTMVLRNANAFPAVAVFELAWQRQSSGGNADASLCTNGATGCVNRWNVESSSGSSSVGGMGISVEVAALTNVKVVTQTLSHSRNYAEVGALFPGLAGAPTIVGNSSYWDTAGGAGTQTVGHSSSNGLTNSGVATETGTCDASPNTSGGNTTQSCTNWCSRGDTLVFGVSGRSASLADTISAVTFNTTGTPAQNVPLTQIAHFPYTGIVNAAGTVFAEVWKAYNPDYMSDGAGAGVTSYSAAVKATAGANPVLTENLGNGDTTMTVASLSDANTRICQGDILSGEADIDGRVITAPAGCGTTGTYTFSPAAGGTVNKSNVIVSSTTLRVLGATGNSFAAGATSNGAVTIVSGPDGSGHYTISAPTNLGAQSYITQGTSSATIRVPSGGALPGVGTLVSVYSVGTSPVGAGALPAGAIVQSVGANSFTVSSAPTTGLVGATVCGGTCAFFNAPSSTSSTTEFSITRSGGTEQWAGGFMCLKGVNDPLVVPVTSTTSKPTTWQETVQ